ncbi:M23 family metallopeptidase [Aureisphaera galaxeae]|uniref:M23 family metallopeptidase n=1 Tax=Aureisphaera galaxeae TaxID=1538023 RepID=UPI0023507EED|nr:M23 family metallopeptidase [Aureisphaera galaxeae]MDC8004395.1 M23 family metallopeptidase [Aureisphaera galaxeae]
MRSYFLLLLLFGIQIHAQNVPTDYFDNPLDIPLILSGNFGELRSNHFHSGLDIKTQQRRGLPIYAPADGYVKRIKVAHYGYGKALYITHPNGYNTVYAHLDAYAGAIQEYVKKKQYEKEEFQIELFPEPEVLPVSKGDIIGYTGNTGSSGGPHLHYEIRDASSRPMNPMLFGINIADNKDPLVNAIMVYPSGEDAHVNGSQKPQKLRLTKQKDGSYRAEGIEALGTLGFGVSTNDQHDGASNKNGSYIITAFFNGEETYKVQFNRFSFSETRYLNRYIDYGYYKKNKVRVQKLFREPNNPLSVIINEVGKGYVSVEDGFSSVFRIEILDFQKNKTVVTIPVTGKQQEITDPLVMDENLDFVVHNQGNSITKGKFSIYIPAESLYEDTYLNIQADVDTLKLHEDVVPLHKNMTLSFDASNYTKEDMGKLYIGRYNYNKPPIYYTTYRNGKKLSAKTRRFGTYVLGRDTIAPTIEPANFQDEKWISKNETLILKIEDDASGIGTYRATINGKFILTEYDYKKDVLVYDFDDNIITEAENKLKVIVVDNVGNSTTFEATFFRKQL